MAASITSAIPDLENLAATLDRAYWEANSIKAKDSIYDCYTAVNKELSELGKLSIQDHDLDYEPISHEFKIMNRRLPIFKKQLDDYVVRIATLEMLDHSISSILQLINQDNDTSKK